MIIIICNEFVFICLFDNKKNWIFETLFYIFEVLVKKACVLMYVERPFRILYKGQ